MICSSIEIKSLRRVFFSGSPINRSFKNCIKALLPAFVLTSPGLSIIAGNSGNSLTFTSVGTADKKPPLSGRSRPGRSGAPKTSSGGRPKNWEIFLSPFLSASASFFKSCGTSSFPVSAALTAATKSLNVRPVVVLNWLSTSKSNDFSSLKGGLVVGSEKSGISIKSAILGSTTSPPSANVLM